MMKIDSKLAAVLSKSKNKDDFEKQMRDGLRDLRVTPTHRLVGMDCPDYIASYGEVRLKDSHTGPDGA